MKSSLYSVDFRTRRHIARLKDLLNQTCDLVEHINGEVAGFAVCIWDDAGCSASTYRIGGPIGEGSLPTYIADKMKLTIYRNHKK